MRTFLAILLTVFALNVIAAGPTTGPAQAIFTRKVGANFYAFEIDGQRRSFRCSFCSFSAIKLAPGDVVQIESTEGRITSIRLSDGRTINAESTTPRRLTWYALVIMLFALIVAVRFWANKGSRAKQG